MATHHYQLKRKRGKWVILADSNNPSAFVEVKGAVVVSCDVRTSRKRVMELAEEHSNG